MKTTALFCVVAGLCDAVTGALLIGAPVTALALVGIVAPHAAALVHLRFVGVFVTCVGLAYLYPWTSPPGPERASRVIVSIELTAFVRLAVALFIGVVVAIGALDTPWITIGLIDAAIALTQVALRSRGYFDRVD